MRCAKILMLWWLRKAACTHWYVEDFSNRPGRKRLVQIADNSRSSLVESGPPPDRMIP